MCTSCKILWYGKSLAAMGYVMSKDTKNLNGMCLLKTDGLKLHSIRFMIVIVPFEIAKTVQDNRGGTRGLCCLVGHIVSDYYYMVYSFTLSFYYNHFVLDPC